MTGLEFRAQLSKFAEEQKELQKLEIELAARGQLHREKFGGWLKECGLPENFGLPELCQLAIRKANEP